MAAPKRTKFERENDLQRIAELYLKGWYQSAIAKEIGVAQPQIAYDLKEIRQRWRESSIRDFDEDRNQELERIDILEREYWSAWERSKEEKTRTRQTKHGDISSASVEKETLLGNPAYLSGVERCIELRCKILGLYAPIKNEVAGKDGAPIDHHVTIEYVETNTVT